MLPQLSAVLDVETQLRLGILFEAAKVSHAEPVLRPKLQALTLWSCGQHVRQDDCQRPVHHAVLCMQLCRTALPCYLWLPQHLGRNVCIAA
jgi:hypothetical protein